MSHGSNISTVHWATYFHQEYIGATLRQKHLIFLDSNLESLASYSEEHNNNSKEYIIRVQKVLKLIT